MKVFTFSLATLLFFLAAPAQNPSSKYSLAINQVETITYDKKASEKGNTGYFTNAVNNKGTKSITAGFASKRKVEKVNSLSEPLRTDECKCPGCILLIDKIAMPGELKRGYKHPDIKAGETLIRYPEGTSYGQLLKELTLKWM